MKYLTSGQVLAIHDQAINRFGGSRGVRDVRLLESAVLRPQASFDGKDLYKGVFDKSAALLQSILKNHPFVDGNKRTALASAGIFLENNGFRLISKGVEEVEFMVKVDVGDKDIGEISRWLRKYSKKIK